MSRTKHHGNTTKYGRDLWGKRGNVAGLIYHKFNRKLATRRVRRQKPKPEGGA